MLPFHADLAGCHAAAIFRRARYYAALIRRATPLPPAPALQHTPLASHYADTIDAAAIADTPLMRRQPHACFQATLRRQLIQAS